MAFVTTLTLQSGDRAALDSIVEEIRTTVERKGAELNGPHTFPPEAYTVPQYAGQAGGRQFAAWEYTVYRRELELVGHEQLAREIVDWSFPDAVHVEVQITQA